jgi:uncharacterized protein YbjT (DUF2867 family)
MQTDRTILVTGATGFIGSQLVAALVARGRTVIAASRHPQPSPGAQTPWRTCDLLRPETLPAALSGVGLAYYLVHSMGDADADFRLRERQAAEAFAIAARDAGVERSVYLGGPMPIGRPSEHLESRLEVGEVLRRGAVPTVELRASMVIGEGSASWRIVRDLTLRLPVMVLPRWLESRSRPLAIEDAIVAHIAAGDLPIEGSTWFDIPGPETLSGIEILERIARLRGRELYGAKVPFLSLRLSALWLRFITGADYGVAKQLALGLREDLLPKSDAYWSLIGHTSLISFDDAARRALADHRRQRGLREGFIRLEEGLVQRATGGRARP